MSLMFVSANAQKYSAALIADSLKENAHAVIREYTKEFELYSVNKGVERIKKVITVLDDNGENFGTLKIGYDKDSKVIFIKVTLYDKNGNKVKKLSQSDFSDSPVQDGATLYSDNRVKFYAPSFPEYPYTVEVEYEINNSNLVSYGSWYPLYGYNISLEHSKLTFIHSPEIPYRKQERNIHANPKTINQGDKTSETWECDYLKAIEYEPFVIALSERVPKLSLMPVQLIYDNHTGTAATWKEYGKWIYDLYKGRDELAETEKINIKKLLGNVQDTVSKIKLLYNYIQEHTRYVGIQLGIGGLQPIPALTVFETGYGDCKALSNYMHSLLKQIGILSYPALVSSGPYIEPIYPDFPNFQQFDHVILCVPFKKDTIWLECTNQIIPFGFLGTFTDDRDVLLITEEGGKMAHTRKYDTEDNLRICHAEFTIDPEGKANCSMKTQYNGLQYYDIFELFNSNADEQKKWIYKNSTLPSLQLADLNIKNYKSSIPSATINETLISKNYCSFTGNYMLLPLNRVNIQSPINKTMKERQSDFIIQRPSVDYDTLVYKIPANYKIETLPEGKTIKSAFGDYSNSVSVKDNNIIYSRKFIINQGRFKASEYKKFYEFCLSVSKADNEKVILTK
jgi:hypothetical protein